MISLPIEFRLKKHNSGEQLETLGVGQIKNAYPRTDEYTWEGPNYDGPSQRPYHPAFSDIAVNTARDAYDVENLIGCTHDGVT